MKARCFIVGNPLTAHRLLAAGGMPTKVFVFESNDGKVHVAYDKFLPILAGRGKPELDKVAVQ